MAYKASQTWPCASSFFSQHSLFLRIFPMLAILLIFQLLKCLLFLLPLGLYVSSSLTLENSILSSLSLDITASSLPWTMPSAVLCISVCFLL